MIEKQENEELKSRILELESKLKKSEATLHLYQKLMDKLPYGLQLFDKDGFSIYFNAKQLELLGLPSMQEGIGKFNVLTDPFAIETGAAELFKKAYCGEVVHHEYEYNLGLESNRWETIKKKRFFEETILPVSQEAEVKLVAALLNDISDKKHSEEELNHSHELIKYVIEHSPYAIAVHDMDLNYVYVSRQFKKTETQRTIST